MMNNNIVKSLVILICLLYVAGCSSFNSRARTAIQPKNVYKPNHIAELAIGKHDDTEIDFVSLAGRFRAKLLKASEAGATSEEIKEYLDTGITVVDLYCHEFFKQISVSKAHREFLRAETNQLGGFLSAVLGLADAGSAVTGGFGALFSFFDASIESYDSAYLVSPDLPTVQALVNQTQSKLAAELTSANATYTYPQAERALTLYANNCTFNGIRGLINSSLASSKATVEKSAAGVVIGVRINKP